MTFDRKAALPLGHRLYTSVATLASWGSGGERGPSSEDYESRGRRMTWAEFYAVALHYIDNPHLIDQTKLEPLPPPKVRLASVKPPADESPADESEKFWAGDRPHRFPETITAGGMWSWMSALGTATSSRKPSTFAPPPRTVFADGHDGPTAAWLSQRDAAGTAVKHGQHATRIERWMVENESPLIVPLRLVKELMRPPVTAANDNRPVGENEDAGMGAERIHNQGSFMPSVPEVLAALGAAYRPHVVTKKCRAGHSRKIELRHAGLGYSFVEGNILAGSTNWRGKLTGLIFRDGDFVAYGDANGKKRRPAYTADAKGLVYGKDSETEKHVASEDAEAVAYTRLKAAGTYVSAQRPDAPRSLAPPPRTARAAANENVLAKAVANTKVMPAVTRLPDGVAKDYGRLAGISEMKGVGGSSIAMHEALTELDRAENLVAAGIDDVDLEVLDSIFDDCSFRSIGMQFEHPESSASHEGRKIVEKTLKRISEKIAA